MFLEWPIVIVLNRVMKKSCKKMVSERFKEVIALSENIPLQYSYLFRLNSFYILTLYSVDTSDQIKNAIRYLDMQKEYAETKEMKKTSLCNKTAFVECLFFSGPFCQNAGKRYCDFLLPAFYGVEQQIS